MVTQPPPEHVEACDVEPILAFPKVLLHDHLDGGLRPATVIELAEQSGYPHLPSHDVDELTRWFGRARLSKSLPDYLAGFAHTFGVLQSRSALVRAARENVEDLAADGVVYAETRFAPDLHLAGGLSMREVLDAVVAGTREGVAEARALGRTIDVRVIVAGSRDRGMVRQAAAAFAASKDPLVVAFDIVGPEAGNPPDQFAGLFHQLREEGRHVTIHAGEGDGVESIRAAAEVCGAERLGHGVRIVEDIAGDVLGPVATFVQQSGVVLETSPSSNVHTGAAAGYAEHPVLRLEGLGFEVTVNTDNRLMSQTSLSQEFAMLAAHQGIGMADVARLTERAARAAFISDDERTDLVCRIRAHPVAVHRAHRSDGER